LSGWERLPVDEVGYIHPSRVLKLSDRRLRDWVRTFEDRRYGGWRNHKNLWRSTLGLDSTRHKRIIDYGCGFGIEALQFARTDNLVTLFDLTDEGLEAAQRVLAVHGFECDTTRDELPEADIFYANGSLHHTPDMPQILEAAPASEARLLVYSDRAWNDKRHCKSFVRAMDDVGDYATWFTPETLEAAAPGWTLKEATYITPKGWYLTARLER
jgi:SAM-dependent methyltransferase